MVGTVNQTADVRVPRCDLQIVDNVVRGGSECPHPRALEIQLMSHVVMFLGTPRLAKSVVLGLQLGSRIVGYVGQKVVVGDPDDPRPFQCQTVSNGKVSWSDFYR